MKTLTTYFNYIDPISLTNQDANLCSHPGECESDVKFISSKPYVKRQLSVINKDALINELSNYGAWDKEELQNHKQNLIRILWIAAGNIIDGQY